MEGVLAQARETTATAVASGSGGGGFFTEAQLLEEHLLSWFLKDLSGAPLDFRGYVSGGEASEDEAAAPWHSDMSQIGAGYYSGYLLKKSSRDPCLWRRRWCILGEDKLWYMKLKHRRTQGRAATISLVANQVLEHPRNSVGCVYVCVSCLYVPSSSSSHRVKEQEGTEQRLFLPSPSP